jgi:hypothetical protein
LGLLRYLQGEQKSVTTRFTEFRGVKLLEIREITVGIEIMDNELTKSEERTLARIELVGKWDSLIYDLSLFLPCAIIIGLSSYYGSTMGILSGLVTYGGFRIWIETQRSQLVPILQSAIRKLKSRCEQPASVKDSERRSSS